MCFWVFVRVCLCGSEPTSCLRRSFLGEIVFVCLLHGNTTDDRECVFAAQGTRWLRHCGNATMQAISVTETELVSYTWPKLG